MSKLSTDVLAITYDVWIGGKKLPLKKKRCINDLSFKDTDEGANTCTINLSDPNFLFIEDSLIVKDKKIKIKYGWSNVTKRETFEGYISAIDIDFPNNGIPKLTITCMDKTHLMNRKKRNKKYKNTTSANVVKQICKKYGYKCVVEENYKFEKQESISQSDSTDIDFITKLAGEETYPFTATLVGDTFYYVKKGKLGESKMTLTYNKYPYEIQSFKPQINKETIKKEVSSSKTGSDKSKSSATVKDNKNRTTDTNKDSTTKKSPEYVYDPGTKKWHKTG